MKLQDLLLPSLKHAVSKKGRSELAHFFRLDVRVPQPFLAAQGQQDSRAGTRQAVMQG